MEDTSSLSSIQSRSISQSVIDNFKKKVLEMEPEVCFFFFFFFFLSWEAESTCIVLLFHSLCWVRTKINWLG